jgi:siderophore synthetase component
MNNLSALMRAAQPQIWQASERALLAKMLSEFMFEEIIVPEPLSCAAANGGSDIFRLDLSGGIEYQFLARKRLFDGYRVIPGSMRRGMKGQWCEAYDPLQFILDIRDKVGLTPTIAGHFLKEVSHTLLADAHIRARTQGVQADLLGLPYHEIEREMDGHPWIVFNKGRLGFDYDDFLRYAPEQGQPIALSWLAVHRSRSTYHAVEGLDQQSLLQQELGQEVLDRFRDVLTQQQLNPDQYHWLPVHEWQWTNMIVPLFGGEISRKMIVSLGQGPDRYLPQQSIRTFTNLTMPEKYHVKLPMSILNTLVYRGLPGERTVVAPRVTAWILSIRDRDAFLREECRLVLLGEVASVNVVHPYYAHIPDAPYQYGEMLGCIWRQSLAAQVAAGEHPVTMASLLHVDGAGRPFIGQLLIQSGLSLDAWLERLFDVVLRPLLHYLYQYGMVFSPHGENAILILKEAMPYRLAMKDFVDDVNLSRYPIPELAAMPHELKDVLRSEPPEGLCQFIWTSLFICHFRYLADLVDQYWGYPESSFWKGVCEAILRYQRRFPQLETRYRLYDLFAPRFPKLCLNRNRLFRYGYDDDGERPHAVQQGHVRNALAQFSPWQAAQSSTVSE